MLAGGLVFCAVMFVNGVCTAGTASASEDVTVVGAAEGPADPLTLWYRRLAARWTEASPVGNGRLGGMVWGGVTRERIDLNEDTLWSGEPYDNLNPGGLAALPEIRRLLRAGNDKEAQRLVERDMNGKDNRVAHFRITFASSRPVKVRVNGEEKVVTAEAQR